MGATPEKILVVDDDLDIRETVAMLLQRRGYEVRLAENGARGLALVEAERPDLILLDLRMPIMDGAEFVQRLRLRSNGLHLGVVVMSAFADLADATGNLPIQGTLRKPFELADLYHAVERGLGAR